MGLYGPYIESLEDLRFGLNHDLVTPSTAFSALMSAKEGFQSDLDAQRAARQKAIQDAMSQQQESTKWVSGLGEDILGWAQEGQTLGSLAPLIQAQAALHGVSGRAVMKQPQIAGALTSLFEGPGYSSGASLDSDDLGKIAEGVAASVQQGAGRAQIRDHVRKQLEQIYGPHTYVSFKATIDNVIDQAYAQAVAQQEGGSGGGSTASPYGGAH